MRYLLDTNIIIEAVAGSQPAVEALHHATMSEWVGYSAITRLEVFGYPDLSPEEEAALKVVIEEFNEIEVTSSIIDRAITIRRAKRIKAPDAIIAATAQEMRATVITRNTTDFMAIDDLTAVNPWTDSAWMNKR